MIMPHDNLILAYGRLMEADNISEAMHTIKVLQGELDVYFRELGRENRKQRDSDRAIAERIAAGQYTVYPIGASAFKEEAPKQFTKPQRTLDKFPKAAKMMAEKKKGKSLVSRFDLD